MALDFSKIETEGLDFSEIEEEKPALDFSAIEEEKPRLDFSNIEEDESSLVGRSKMYTSPEELEGLPIQREGEVRDRVPVLKEPERKDKWYDFIMDVAPTQYLTKKGRKLAKHDISQRGRPLRAGANAMFEEMVKGADLVVGGAFGVPGAKQLTMGAARGTARQGFVKLSTKTGKKFIRPKAIKGARIKELKRARQSEILKGTLDSENFIRKIEGNLTKAEREALPFVMERMGKVGKEPIEKVKSVPKGTPKKVREAVAASSGKKAWAETRRIIKKHREVGETLTRIGRQDLIDLVEKPTKAMKEQAKIIRKYYDEGFDFLSENMDSKSYLDDYVTHIWDLPKQTVGMAGSGFSKSNPFLKKRTIPSLAEGIKQGLNPKTTDITEMLRVYDSFKLKSVFNKRFADELAELTDDAGNKIIMRADKAPDNWVPIDHPALNRARAIGGVSKTKGDLTVKSPVLTKTPVAVHPDIAKDVATVFSKPFNNAVVNSLAKINAFTKKAMLSGSFFHHMALTESAFSTGIGREALKLWNPVKIYRALKYKNYKIFEDMKLAKDGLDSGLTLGALPDVQNNIVAEALGTMARRTRNIPGLKHITKGMFKANEVWDRALWDYYHNNLKLMAYEKNVFDGIADMRKTLKRDLLPMEIKKLKRSMAGFVNDSYGGQNWDMSKIFGNKKMQQITHMILLAPDWTFSVLKQAGSPFVGAGKALTSPTAAGRAVGKAQAKQGAKFWARAAIYYGAISQSINYYNTKKEYGEGRFTWDNPPGKQMDIFIGRNNDGPFGTKEGSTERYLRMGKQFREVLEWGIKPVEKLGSKLAPVTRESIRQITKHDPGSGYPTPWGDEKLWTKKSLTERAKSIAKMPIPFSLRPYVEDRPRTFMMTFPTSKGLSPFRAVKEMEKALLSGDREQLRDVFYHALRNNLNAYQHLKTAKNAVTSDITNVDKDLAEKVIKEMGSVSEVAKADLLLKYKEQGIFSPGVINQMKRQLKKRSDVIQLQKVLGVKIKSSEEATQKRINK